MKPWLAKTLWTAAALGLAWLLWRAFQPTPVLVDLGSVEPRRLQVTVDDDGITRVRERYTISAPIQGRLLRTPLDPGDEVLSGDTIVAEFEPIAPAMLDARARAEAEARLRQAEAAKREAEARRDQAEADLNYASAERKRIEELTQQGIGRVDDLERAERDEHRARDGLRAAEFAAQVAAFQEQLAAATLEYAASGDNAEPTAQARRIQLRSPIDGRVLRVFEESARTLMAGTPILEVGNTALLELVADYLSQDAVKVRPGMDVEIAGWGGETREGHEAILHGRVRVVEPGGFTKVSALGVEEQRVNVVVDPVGEPASWAQLGDGFRVDLRVVLWEQADVLTVPTGALFRDGTDWAVYVARDGAAHRQAVELGRRSGLLAQVRSGLEAGDRVILYPSEMLADDTAIEGR